MAASTSAERQHYALQTIFSFFLGLMVLAFVGVGVNTFYPSPTEQHQKQQQVIQRQIEALSTQANGKSFDATQQAEMQRLQNQQNALQDVTDAEMKVWARNTSIILVIFATIVLVISLVLSEQLRVISNGLLLGGLFTMVYGVGWVIFSGNSKARFFVIAFALAVTVGLGYVKFVRERATRGRAGATAAAAADGSAPTAPGLSDLEARVSALEARTEAAASALSAGRSPADAGTPPAAGDEPR